MNNNDTKVQNGFPKISDLNQKRPFIIFLMIVALFGIGVIYLYSTSSTHKDKVEKKEETYTFDQTNQPSIQPPVANKEVEVPKEKEMSHEEIQQQIALFQQRERVLQERLAAPLMVVNNPANSESTETNKPEIKSNGTNNSQSPKTSETIEATKMASPQFTIAQGTLIPAVLESAINSDLPGSLRAIVNQPVYSEDGSNILIPPGSRLIGEYKSNISEGQSRIFIIWTRLIEPKGISIQLQSEGVDTLGQAGSEADEIDRHFWQKFGTASLLSVLGLTASNLQKNNTNQENSPTYADGIANSFNQSANESFQSTGMIATTLKKYQGKEIFVFVGHDLSFQAAMQQVAPKINVF